jgi:hypothetical protein
VASNLSRWNGWISVNGYGSRLVTVLSVAHGMEVVGEEARARRHRDFYPHYVSRGSVRVVVWFRDQPEADAFAKWLWTYSLRLADPSQQLGPARVLVPGFAFDRTGVIESGLVFGDDQGNPGTVAMALVFSGTADAASFVNPEVSRFTAAAKDQAASKYFYPEGTQQSGDEGLDAIYRDRYGEIADPDPPPTGGSGGWFDPEDFH